MDVRYARVSKSFGGVDALIELELDIPRRAAR